MYIRKELLLLLLPIILSGCRNTAEVVTSAEIFANGVPWLDTDGKPIEAHGGGMLIADSLFYWYGENHALGEGNRTGISCYSSKDLIHWKNQGVVLPKAAIPQQFRDSGVCERPKVIFNRKTGKYVMWMHLDGRGYILATAGVAVANTPAGPFKFLGYKRPVKYDYGYKLSRGKGYDPHEKELGNTFRDMNLFVDDDMKAYVFYASEDNASMYCVRLNESYTDIERPVIRGRTWQRILPSASREAPAPFKYKGKYYLFTSGLTGWSPNPADIAISDSILGPWKQMGNPCQGPESESTFRSQSTFVLPAPGKTEDCFIFMADRWNGNELQKSTFVWIPFIMRVDASVQLEYIDKWNLSIYDRQVDDLAAPSIQRKGVHEIGWNHVEGASVYKICKNGSVIMTTTGNSFMIPVELAGKAFNYTVLARNLKGISSVPSQPITISWMNADTTWLSDVTPEEWEQGFGVLEKDRAINQSPLNIAGKVYPKGLGTHANSVIVYNICGRYSRFSAWVGVDHYPVFSDASSIQFEIYGDGICLFRSAVMRVNDPAIRVDLDIRKINELRLIVNDAGDGNHYDHADWADARLIP